jgi:arsenite-transporting ATPase
MKLANVVLVMGKGGVGKTTVARGIGAGLSRDGHRVVVLELGAGAAGAAHAEHAGDVAYEVLSEDDALLETASEIFGSQRVSKLLFGNFAIKRLIGVVPGVREYCLVVAARQRLAGFERVVVDMPATGHGIAWLSAAHKLARLVPHGKARSQADALDAALRSARETSYVLVTLPEPLVLAESAELERALRERLGVQIDQYVMNRVPDEPEVYESDLEALLEGDASMASAVAEVRLWAGARRAVRAQAAILSQAARTHFIGERAGEHSALAVGAALGFEGAAR